MRVRFAKRNDNGAAARSASFVQSASRRQLNHLSRNRGEGEGGGGGGKGGSALIEPGGHIKGNCILGMEERRGVWDSENIHRISSTDKKSTARR